MQFKIKISMILKKWLNLEINRVLKEVDKGRKSDCIKIDTKNSSKKGCNLRLKNMILK